jgi:hypothetical protein
MTTFPETWWGSTQKRSKVGGSSLIVDRAWSNPATGERYSQKLSVTQKIDWAFSWGGWQVAPFCSRPLKHHISMNFIWPEVTRKRKLRFLHHRVERKQRLTVPHKWKLFLILPSGESKTILVDDLPSRGFWRLLIVDISEKFLFFRGSWTSRFLLAKTPSAWQFAIQWHIFLPKTRSWAQLDVNQANFLCRKRSSLMSIDCRFASFCVNIGHSLRGWPRLRKWSLVYVATV